MFIIISFIFCNPISINVFTNTILRISPARRFSDLLTTLASLKSVYSTRLSLQGVAVSQEATQMIDKYVKQWILDDEVFWGQISNLINIFEPICKWLKIVEGD